MSQKPQPDQIKEQRDKEHANRVTNATQCAHLLSTLMLGEVLNTGPQSHVLAVPGGWIFVDHYNAGATSTFVPQPPSRAPSLADKIIVP